MQAAGLPVVATRGDTLADLVDSHGLGATVPPEDPAALADALAHVLDDPGVRERAAANVAALAPEYAWERTVLPLARFCATSGRGPHTGVLRAATAARYPLLLGETREALGFRGAVRRAGRSLRRALRRQ